MEWKKCEKQTEKAVKAQNVSLVQFACTREKGDGYEKRSEEHTSELQTLR